MAETMRKASKQWRIHLGEQQQQQHRFLEIRVRLPLFMVREGWPIAL